MKKFCFSLLVAVAVTTSFAMAQQAPDLRAQAMENTRILTQKIALDDARTPQVKRFTYERLVQENEVKQMYSIDPAMLQSKLAVIEKEYAEKLKGVLTDAQYQRYQVAFNAPAAAPAVAVATPAPVAQPAPAVKAAVPVKTPAQPKSKVSAVAPAKAAPAKKGPASSHASTSVASRP